MSDVFPLVTLFFFIFGACIGSFLNVVICRLPKGESLISPGSHCPRCGHHITGLENIPVISWLYLRARCRECRERISWHYPIVEIASAVIFVLVWCRVYFSGLPLTTLPSFLFLTTALFAAAIIDIKHHIIPDKITITGCLLAFLLAVLVPGSRDALELMTRVPTITRETTLIPLVPTIETLVPLNNIRVLALLDTLLGFLTAYCLLVTMRSIGKLLWGRSKISTEEAQQLSLQNNILYIGSNLIYKFPDTGNNDTKITIAAHQVKLVYVDKTGSIKAHFISSARLSIRNSRIITGSLNLDQERIISLTGYTKKWHIPRNVLGYGDIKLLAMIGAFLGVDGFLFVLLTASLSGFAFSGIGIILTRKRFQTVPFAPFIGGGIFLWIFYGPELFLKLQAILNL
ncbi:MAG: prepilin peptidase [Verrucomicrobiota bacterium]